VTSQRYAATPEELLELARKYETLLVWRRAHRAAGTVAERSQLRGLARAFPGALRELDTEPLEVIESRVAALARAARGGPSEPWMHWMVAYHAVMRAALWLKPRLARGAAFSRDAEELAALLARAPTCRIPLDLAFVERVARPPSGRLNRVVFRVLGEVFELDGDALWDGLFPARRGTRFAPRGPGTP